MAFTQSLLWEGNNSCAEMWGKTARLTDSLMCFQLNSNIDCDCFRLSPHSVKSWTPPDPTKCPLFIYVFSLPVQLCGESVSVAVRPCYEAVSKSSQGLRDVCLKDVCLRLFIHTCVLLARE